MAHYVESNGLHMICKHLVDDTTLKARARGGANYIIPVAARILATVLVAVLTGRLIQEG